ncbi:PREDICTED: cuticle collagen 2-like isoform X2 [Rhinopithecus bieti]|uniref:cuticle collagen 2-like isoform X2 n=1 Tax=Rhinopithecus bieti TaxID=61621 RepID=UPI00083BC0F9|nr:PREDICTED: cuticle collagen 2-like isoform X2 [Rhinopithecus bieti]
MRRKAPQHCGFPAVSRPVSAVPPPPAPSPRCSASPAAARAGFLQRPHPGTDSDVSEKTQGHKQGLLPHGWSGACEDCGDEFCLGIRHIPSSQHFPSTSGRQACPSPTAPAGGIAAPLRPGGLPTPHPNPRALGPRSSPGQGPAGSCSSPGLRLPALYPLQGMKPRLEDTGSQGEKNKKALFE